MAEPDRLNLGNCGDGWRFWLLLAEGHLKRRLFGDMLRRMAALPSPAG